MNLHEHLLKQTSENSHPPNFPITQVYFSALSSSGNHLPELISSRCVTPDKSSASSSARKRDDEYVNPRLITQHLVITSDARQHLHYFLLIADDLK